MNKKINVTGMHCGSCEMLITESLNETEGIISSKANHKTGSVIVEYDENKINENKIKTIIQNEGYNVK